MNIVSILLFFTFYNFIYLGISMYRINRKSSLNRLMLILSIPLAIWAFAFASMHITDDREIAFFWYRISTIGWIAFIPITLHLLLVFSEKDNLINRYTLLLIYLPAVLGIIYTNLWVISPDILHKVAYGWAAVPVRDFHLVPGFIFILGYVLYLGFGFINLFIWGKRSRFKREKKQVKIIISTTLISFTLGSFFDNILPIMNIVLFPLCAPITCYIWIFGFWYAINKYRLGQLSTDIAGDKIIAQMNDMLLMVDEAGTIIQTNPNTCELLEFPESEILGKTIFDIIHENRVIEDEFIYFAEKQYSSRVIEVNYRTKSGELIPVKLSGTAFRDTEGDLIGVVYIAYDLRETKKLIEMDKLKSNFFANISHEIRTPLTLILSPIESVIQGDYGKKIDKGFFKNIQRNAIRLLKLINNLLDFSKIEAGRMSMRVKEVDIAAFLRNYVGTVHSASESNGIALNFISFNDTVENLWFDPEKMDKVIMNLFSNALKFTDRGGEIMIRVKDDDKNCWIEFGDTGCGITADNIDKVFDRFGQADSSSTRKYEGTGIGLALAKELVEMHGGNISLKSKHIDDYPDEHGSIFKITLPKGREYLEGIEGVEFITDSELEESVSDHRFIGIREMDDLRDEEKQAEDDISKGEASKPRLPVDEKHKSLINILVVDDNPDMRNFLKFLLQERYNIHLAINGEDGLKKAGEIKPDLIISDVMMPIMDGYEMTTRIKKDIKLKSIPIIMLTAKADIANKIEGLEYGADDYLTKPFNSKELLTRIASLLKTAMMQSEIVKLNENLEALVMEQSESLLRGHELNRYLPPQLVDSILNGEKHVTFETDRKKLTIFFSDIKGFTETTDAMESEELSALLNEYLTEMTMIAHRYGATIDKFIGDAIMIFFGAPEATNENDHALRCVRMAIEMQEKMKKLKNKWYNEGIEYPLAIRIGINTGTATVGNFGAKERLSYTAIGSQVNLASRLEGLCKPGGILISHPTYALVNNEIECKQRGKVNLKGIHRDVMVYDVVM